MENNEKGVSNLELERMDGLVSQIIPEEKYVKTVHLDKKGAPTGKTTMIYENKFTVKEVNEGGGLTGTNQDGKAVKYQQVKHVIVEWDADVVRGKAYKANMRGVIATLKKNTGLVTKNTKGEPLTIAEGASIGLADVIAWREGHRERLPEIKFAYSSLDDACKDRVHAEVIVPLEKKLNKAPKFSKAGQAKIMDEMLTRLVEAGIIAKPSLEDVAKLAGVEPIVETKEEEAK